MSNINLTRLKPIIMGKVDCCHCLSFPTKRKWHYDQCFPQSNNEWVPIISNKIFITSVKYFCPSSVTVPQIICYVVVFKVLNEMILIWITVRKCKMIPRTKVVARFSHNAVKISLGCFRKLQLQMNGKMWATDFILGIILHLWTVIQINIICFVWERETLAAAHCSWLWVGWCSG